MQNVEAAPAPIEGLPVSDIKRVVLTYSGGLELSRNCRGASEPPPAPLLAPVHAHKPALVHELQTPATWTPADWRAHFHERAAIPEHDAGLPRGVAEERRCRRVFSCGAGGGVAARQETCSSPQTIGPRGPALPGLEGCHDQETLGWISTIRTTGSDRTLG